MPSSKTETKVLITGADGFVGQNLRVHLAEKGWSNIRLFTRDTPPENLASLVAWSDTIVHLAGANRAIDESEFDAVNRGFTERIADSVRQTNARPHIIYASSIQVERGNAYGNSKLAGEEVLRALAVQGVANVSIYRLPNVFGKWSRPNYNSAIATFCDAVANDRDFTIHDPDSRLRLVYIDDLVEELIRALANPPEGLTFRAVSREYETTVGEVAGIIAGFAEDRTSLKVGRVGNGLVRALYATYLTYLPHDSFSYDMPGYSDPRGMFVEVLKTSDCGQFSFFTCLPGVTRGQHYHHTKTEKFVVVQGRAVFRSRDLMTGALHEIEARAEEPRVVQTIPGWIHDITNSGTDNLIVLVWASEIFDRAHPDTISGKVEHDKN